MTISSRQLNEIVRSIKVADFFELENVRTRARDAPVNILRVTMDGRTREVRGQGLLSRDLKESPAAKRQRALWFELLTKVPSPDPEHNCEFYKL